ncbi:MAG: oligosaccharide flippase family protein [Cellulophaga sp.]
MGIVLKQSLNNTIITFLGFGIGAVNTLFLYTRYLTDEYYGLVTVILSTSTLLMPIFAFGAHNTIVKFYSSFKGGKNKNGFFTLMLLLPLLLIIPTACFAYYAHDIVATLLAKKNSIVKNYVWYIFFIGMGMAYFEIFYAWSRVQMKSVFGNFMKEVFCRLGVFVLLLLVYYSLISVDTFLKTLVVLYILRTIIMKLYVFKMKFPKLNFHFPENINSILKYSTLIILGGSSAVILLEVDRFMINQYVEIKNVAYYSVAVFIAAVIAIPSRSMHQITYPLTSELLTKKDSKALNQLYKKSSLTLFIISGLLFLLILLNLNDLYMVLPVEYRGGSIVVFCIGLSKVYDALLGNNNAILYNSDYYKTILFLGVGLAILIILLNIVFIPKYGINGAAFATLLAMCCYNTVKLMYIKRKFKMHPFTVDTLKVFAILLGTSGLFYFYPFSFNPIINIVLKSSLIVVSFTWIIYKLNISEDINDILRKLLRLK